MDFAVSLSGLAGVSAAAAAGYRQAAKAAESKAMRVVVMSVSYHGDCEDAMRRGSASLRQSFFGGQGVSGTGVNGARPANQARRLSTTS